MSIPHSFLSEEKMMLIANLLILVLSGCTSQPRGADTCSNVVLFNINLQDFGRVPSNNPPPHLHKSDDSSPAAWWLTSSGPLYLGWTTGLSPGISYTLWFGGR